MNCNHHFIILAALITTSFSIGAQEVYESTDQQGVPEFSDQPGPDAKEIDVKPNVVDVAPAEALESSSPASATGAVQTPAGNTQSEVAREGVAGDYNDDYENRRDIDRAGEERREHSEEVVRQPVRKGSGGETVHKGAHRGRK